MASVSIHDYDTAWPREFEVAAPRLHRVLGAHALGVDHVGSTSVPGLAAKDVIDVQVTVVDLDDPELAERMEAAGYARYPFVSDVPPPGRNLTARQVPKMMFSEQPGERRVNIHIRRRGAENTRYVLLVRDYLRVHPNAAGVYGELKRAAARLAVDLDDYYSVKDPFVGMVLLAAEAWAEDVAWIADRRAHWEAVYESRQPDEVSWHQDNPARSLRLIGQVAASLDAAILDVGGGASRLVDGLLATGYTNVTVVDLSATALDHAKRRLGTCSDAASWIEADVTTFRADAAVDVWHDRAVFHFLCDPVDRDRYVSAMRGAVRRGGHAIIATFAEDGPARCSGLLVRRYTEAELIAALAPGFAPIRLEREAHTTPTGATQHFLYGLFSQAS